MPDEKLHPRNRTARLTQARAAGNPVTAELESGVGNCFPGLEFDVRNVDRRFFPFLVVDFLTARDAQDRPVPVIELVEVDLARAEAESAPAALLDGLQRLATEPGPWRVRRLQGEFAGFGPRDVLVADLGTRVDLPVDGWTAVRLLRPATEVTVELERAGAAAVSVTGVRASYLTDDGAFAPMFEAGELTQSLCSPWTHDFRDCGCFYWSSNHPDLSLPAVPLGVPPDDPGWGVRTLWLRADREGDTPPPAAPPNPPEGPQFRRSAEMDYFEINQRWQDLDVVLDGRELRSPYDPTEVPGVPLEPAELLPTLRYAAGVEVAVMVEYLAAAYSLDVSAGAAGSELRDDARAARQQLLLVAFSEMRHLREVNRVLFELHQRTGGTTTFTPALGIASKFRGTAGFPEREVRFRRLTPDVMEEFVRVEAPSLTVDGLYSSLLATFERDNDDDLADRIRSVMADGSEHYATFRAMQEWLARHDPEDYLVPLQEAPPDDQGRLALQQRYEQVLDLLFRGYQLGVPAGTTRVNTARAIMLGPQGIEGACEDLARRGLQPAFTVPADPRFAPVPPP
jgi:Ferritin-like